MLFNHKYLSATEQNSGGDVVITASNYEHYFILYIDGELTEAENVKVETFLKDNPIYKKELDNLLQTKLEIENITFDKNVLLKTNEITLENYEQYFLLSVDKELNNEYEVKLVNFLKVNPALQKDFSLLQKTRVDTISVTFNKSLLLKNTNPLFSENNVAEILCSYLDKETTVDQNIAIEQMLQNDTSLQKEITLLKNTKLQKETIIYPYKKHLLRKEEKAVRVLPIWLRYATAACLLLITTIYFGKNYFNKNQQVEDNPIVKTPNNNNTNIIANKDTTFVINNSVAKDVIIKVDENKGTLPNDKKALLENKINQVVNIPLKQNYFVTIPNNQRTINNNDVANKKVLILDKVIFDKEENNDLSLQSVAIAKVKLNENEININENEILKLRNNVIASSIVTDDANDDVTIAGIDVNKIDKNGKVKKTRSKFSNFVQKKINDISNTSIEIGKYEIALAK